MALYIKIITFVIEGFTNIIRPFTLVFRFWVNVNIGHFLLEMGAIPLLFGFLLLSLFIFELAMSCIHAYVYFLLLHSYFSS